MNTPTKSKSSPLGGKRGCLCPDGTHLQKVSTNVLSVVNGDLQAQGIGKIASIPPQQVTATEVNGVRTTIRVSS
jgi:hypothetical protein